MQNVLHVYTISSKCCTFFGNNVSSSSENTLRRFAEKFSRLSNNSWILNMSNSLTRRSNRTECKSQCIFRTVFSIIFFENNKMLVFIAANFFRRKFVDTRYAHYWKPLLLNANSAGGSYTHIRWSQSSVFESLNIADWLRMFAHSVFFLSWE